MLHADKGYHSNEIRRLAEAEGTMPNTSPKADCVWKDCFSPDLYCDRNAIERMVCPLKYIRRIATRYDRIATHLLTPIQVAAVLCYWFLVRSRVVCAPVCVRIIVQRLSHQKQTRETVQTSGRGLRPSYRPCSK